MSEQEEDIKDQAFHGDGTWVMVENTPPPSCVVDYPRKEPIKGQAFGKVRVRLLTQEQQHLAQIFAAQFTNEDLEHLHITSGTAWDELYQSYLNLEIVQRACFSEEEYQDKGKYKMMFPPVKLMKIRMTDDELSYLIKAYLTLQQTKGAIRDVISGEDLRFWTFMIDNQPEQALANLTHSGMADLLISMSQYIENLQVKE